MQTVGRGDKGTFVVQGMTTGLALELSEVWAKVMPRTHSKMGWKSQSLPFPPPPFSEELQLPYLHLLHNYKM